MDKTNATIFIAGVTLHRKALGPTIEGNDAVNYVRKKHFDKIF